MPVPDLRIHVHGDKNVSILTFLNKDYFSRSSPQTKDLITAKPPLA